MGNTVPRSLILEKLVDFDKKSDRIVPQMKFRLKTPVSLSLFTHNSTDKVFISEASDIGDDQLFQRVYNDACDVGFNVVNVASGQSILVTLLKETQDDDGETVSWEYVPSYEDVQRHPKLKNYRFLIYND